MKGKISKWIAGVLAMLMVLGCMSTLSVEKVYAASAKIKSAEFVAYDALEFTLSSAVALKASDVTVYCKTYRSGKYVATAEIESLTTKDKKNYTIDFKDYCSSGAYYQIKAKGVTAYEFFYGGLYITSNGTLEEAVSLMANETIYREDEQGVYLHSYGKIKSFKIDKLPTGIKYDLVNNHIIYYGTPTKTGITISKITYKDGRNNQYTYHLKWLVYDSTHMVGASVEGDNYSRNYVGGKTNLWGIMTVVGGSGSYDYKLLSTPKGVSNVDVKMYGSYVELSGTVTKAGTYTFKIRFFDSCDSSIKTDVTCKIVVNPTYKVTGKITDANGNPMQGITVYAEQFSYGSSVHYEGVSTNAKGEYTLKLPKGNFLVSAESPCGEVTRVKKLTVKGTAKVNFQFTKLYRVKIASSNSKYSMKDVTSWIAESEEAQGWCGAGEYVYLPAGTYSLSGSYSKNGYDVSATITTLKVKKSKTTATVKTSKITATKFYNAIVKKNGKEALKKNTTEPIVIAYTATKTETICVKFDVADCNKQYSVNTFDLVVMDGARQSIQCEQTYVNMIGDSTAISGVFNVKVQKGKTYYFTIRGASFSNCDYYASITDAIKTN